MKERKRYVVLSRMTAITLGAAMQVQARQIERGEIPPAINEAQIGPDMAGAEVGPFTDQRMIEVTRRERLVGCRSVDGTTLARSSNRRNYRAIYK